MTKHYQANAIIYYVPILGYAGFTAILGMVLISPDGMSFQKANYTILAVLLLFSAYGVYRHLSMPHRITVNPDRLIVFKSVLGERSLSPEQMLRVRLSAWNNEVEFKTEFGSFCMVRRIRDFPEFLKFLIAQNESIEIVGY